MKQLVIFCIFISALTSCNLSKEVDINLPTYSAQSVVECYLVPGQRFELLLTRSNSFFDPLNADNAAAYLESILIKGADVKIIYLSDTIQLIEGVKLNPANGQISNYSSGEIVPFDNTSIFELLITLADGNKITANTLIPNSVPIDSVRVEYNNGNKTLATVFIYHKDDRNTVNYYRRMIHIASLDSIASQDYTVDDKISDTEVIAYGMFYEREDNKPVVGDTLIFTLMHTTREYNEFAQSKDNANAANGNSFGQPGQIRSNLTGQNSPIGIFTGFYIKRDTFYLPQ